MKPYTLITGASTGFGKALAIECAKNKVNLILVALPKSGLLELGDFLRQNFKIEVLTFEINLSTKENCHVLYDDIKNCQVSVNYLINNAGMLSNGLFENLKEDYFLAQINVNVTAPTLLIKLFMEDFKSNSPSGILNVSSMASFFYLPKKQVYGGTKAYLLSFSKSLRKELRPYNITVSTVCPGGMNTTTSLCHQNRKLGWISRNSVLNPEAAAKETLRSFYGGQEVIIPGKVNKLFMFLDAVLPSAIKNRMTANSI